MTDSYEFKPPAAKEVRQTAPEHRILGYGAAFGAALEGADPAARHLAVERIRQHAKSVGGLALTTIDKIYERALESQPTGSFTVGFAGGLPEKKVPPKPKIEFIPRRIPKE